MDSIQIPEIRFRFARLVYNTISVPLAERDKSTLPDPESIKKKVVDYQNEWKKIENKIINGICNCFDLNFYLKTIDVNISPYLRPISTPLLLNTKYEPDQFIDLLTHELLHILLNDNTTYNNSKLIETWKSIYSTDDMLTLNHIWVHAGLKYIYLDVLKNPYRLERDKEECKKWPSYYKAWEIVEEVGYKELIDKFKAKYPEIQNQ